MLQSLQQQQRARVDRGQCTIRIAAAFTGRRVESRTNAPHWDVGGHEDLETALRVPSTSLFRSFMCVATYPGAGDAAPAKYHSLCRFV